MGPATSAVTFTRVGAETTPGNAKTPKRTHQKGPQGTTPGAFWSSGKRTTKPCAMDSLPIVRKDFPVWSECNGSRVHGIKGESTKPSKPLNN